MRWTRLTPDEKLEHKRRQQASWHRVFAWKPVWDHDTRMVYWLEFVWRRGSGDWYKYAGYYDSWEYRGGTRECPEIKQPPPPGALPDKQKCICIGICTGKDKEGVICRALPF